MPNLIPDWLPWMRPAGRLIWSVVLFVIGLIIFFVLVRRPKPDRPATWAECIAGAVGVFGMMTLAYAVIPHEWITFSDKYLRWTPDKVLVGTYLIKPNYQQLRDLVVVVIYSVFFGANLLLWVKWQQRLVPKPEPAVDEGKVLRTSRFGRPVKSKA